jgi:hypothetical protein
MRKHGESGSPLPYLLIALYALIASFFIFVAVSDGRFIDAALFLFLFTAVSFAIWKMPSFLKDADKSIGGVVCSVAYVATVFYLVPVTYDIASGVPIVWVPSRGWLFVPSLFALFMAFSYLRNRIRAGWH